MNLADSERIAAYYQARGFKPAASIEEADEIVINTCVVRQQAEDRIYGLVRNIRQRCKANQPRIVITGCLVGAASREPTGMLLKKMKKRLTEVDEFLPIEEVGFSYPQIRVDKTRAWVPVSNGCNNFCTYCIVPFSRGQEISRPFDEIIDEVKDLAARGYKEITFLGQNVNSYGADLIKSKIKDQRSKFYTLSNGRRVKPVMVKHLGKKRIPTLFPYLLEEICKIAKIQKVSFLSANPWDFSDKLIEVIVKNPKIDRHIHLPVQSGDDEILRRMNRWYTASQYLNLIKKIKSKIPNVTFGTDIIVGFPKETKKAFENTVKLCKKVGFRVAYIAKYSPRPGTAADKAFEDNVSYKEKTCRFHILDQLINK